MSIKFPYGNSDFYRISSQRQFYLDRTGAIPLLEEAGEQLLFLRPRRFGKSLLLSVLENYYDVAKSPDFEHLFGHLVIGPTPTALHNRYFVMRWDFSTVDGQGDYEQIRQALYDHLNDQIHAFAVKYQTLLPVAIDIHRENALSSFASALTALRQTPYPLYLLIDEYDNFANEVLMSSRDGGRQRYDALVRGEGVFKTLFKNIKSASQGMGLERVFITGVSPVVMADMSSGYNVAKNIYLMPQLNALCGFTHSEVTTALQQVAAHCGFTDEKVAEALALVRTFYNGYRFHPAATEMVYNSTLVLYFLDALQRDCQYPEEILDSNLSMDRNRLLFISQLNGAESLISDALNEATPLSVSTLAHRFGVADMLESEKSIELLIALLYYLGVLTLAGRDENGKLLLQIPNLVIRRLYAERLREVLLPSARTRDAGKAAAEALYQRGELQPLCDFVEQKLLDVLDNRDYLHANELTIKMAFLSLLFEDHFFIVDSEPAIKRGYGDLILIVRPDMRQYKLLDVLLEFKFLKLNELGMSGEELRQKSVAELAQHELVKAKFAEADRQLQQYRATLQSHYGTLLRLRTYAVVALGFERLLWQEIKPAP